jgi:hypothetical protein
MKPPKTKEGPLKTVGMQIGLMWTTFRPGGKFWHAKIETAP